MFILTTLLIWVLLNQANGTSKKNGLKAIGLTVLLMISLTALDYTVGYLESFAPVSYQHDM